MLEVVGASLGKQVTTEDTSVSHVQFTVPMVLPGLRLADRETWLAEQHEKCWQLWRAASSEPGRWRRADPRPGSSANPAGGSINPAHEFNYPDDVAQGMQLFAWIPCERCGRPAKLHLKREVKPAH